MSDFEISLTGWKAWTALALLVFVGFLLGSIAYWRADPLPYRSADWSLIERSDDCVYARRDDDGAGIEHTVFVSYHAFDLSPTATCPRDPNSMVIVNGRAIVAHDAPE